MNLSFDDPELDSLARRLAAVTGEDVEGAVKTAVVERLERAERRGRVDVSVDRVMAIVRAYNAKPVVDPRTPEEMLYDDRGLPG